MESKVIFLKRALWIVSLGVAVSTAYAGCETFFRNILHRDEKTCCRATEVVQADTKLVTRAKYDPYYAGSDTYLGTRGSREPVDFEFKKPEKIGGHQLVLNQVREVDRDDVLMSKLLRTRRPYSELSAPAGKGAFSDVSFFEPYAPVNATQEWLQNHARLVVKMRKFGGKIGPHFMDYYKRDLALRDVLVQFTDAAKLKGKPFMRVARDYSTPEMLGFGVIVQESAHGLTAYRIQEALTEIRIKGLSQSKNAKQILLAAGVNPESPQEILEMQNSLNAMEQFYRKTHYDVLNFERTNLLPAVGNQVQEGSHLVGLDFNHGRNQIWSAKERMWIVIDW